MTSQPLTSLTQLLSQALTHTQGIAQHGISRPLGRIDPVRCPHKRQYNLQQSAHTDTDCQSSFLDIMIFRGPSWAWARPVCLALRDHKGARTAKSAKQCFSSPQMRLALWVLSMPTILSELVHIQLVEELEETLNVLCTPCIHQLSTPVNLRAIA
jgi:hypothetical protein